MIKETKINIIIKYMTNQKRILKIKLLTLLILVSLFIGEIDSDNSNTYRSLVDGYEGFYRIVDPKTGESLPYENNTFEINIGDKIVWVNEDPSDTITIISEQGIWKENKGILKDTGKQVNHTFNKKGNYTFYIKEYRQFAKQKIIVSNNIPSNEIETGDTQPTISRTTMPITSLTNTTGIMNDTSINIENISSDNDTKDNNIIENPILMPLNILKNFKKTGMIIVIIIILLLLVK